MFTGIIEEQGVITAIEPSGDGVRLTVRAPLAVSDAQRGDSISISGVYGGAQDPLPMLQMFDKQLTIRMGQANVRRWIPELLPLVDDPGDPSIAKL